MRKNIIKLSIFLAGAISICGLVSLLIGSRLAAPVHRKISKPPVELKADSITFNSGEKLIKGWFLNSEKNKGIIILMHGVRGDRTVMTERAKYFF